MLFIRLRERFLLPRTKECPFLVAVSPGIVSVFIISFNVCFSKLKYFTFRVLNLIKQVIKSTQSQKYLDSRNRGHYAGKVKCSTLKPAQEGPGAITGNRIMLGLKDSNNDSICEYEQRSITSKQKKKRTKHASKQKSEMTLPKPMEFKEQQTDMFTCQDHSYQNKADPEDETSLTFYNESDPNQDTSKPFMGSIGSWINDLFNVPSKRPNFSEKANAKSPESERVDENSEYFKSINALKEQFKKKLKSETSVHISTGDKLMQLNFVSGHEIKRARSLPSNKSFESLQEVDDLCDIPQKEVATLECQDDTISESDPVPQLAAKSNGQEVLLEPLKPRDEIVLSNLTKERKKSTRKSRLDLAELEEYILPTPADLSKRLLLNVNEKEKCSQLYKSPPLSVQESQRYGQRKSKSYQSITRCYTTNANVIENSNSKSYLTVNNKSKGFPFFPTEPAEVSGSEDALTHNTRQKPHRGRMSRKTFSEFFRESSTFVRVKANKSLLNTQVEPVRNEPKSSSDDLVKYLMKKIKTNHRSQPPKKKTSTLTPVISNGKNRFMQSATNSLVMSVMAKKEGDNTMLGKNGSRISLENKLAKSEIVTKPGYSSKDWTLKYNDNNIRFDIKRAVSQHKFNKNSYLLEDYFKSENEDLVDKSVYKNSKRSYIDPLKSKEHNEKYNKRQEVKNMLSKLDVKSNVFQMNKVKQKDQKKKVVKTILENIKPVKGKETQIARFQKEHELFKNNIRTSQQNVEGETSQEATEENAPDADTLPTSLSTELAVLNTSLQMVPEKEEIKCVETDSLSPSAEVSEMKMIECLSIKGKHNETQPAYKDKLIKTKSLQYIKEGDSKGLLNSLSDYCNEDKKDSPQVYEPPICSPPEIRSVKPLDTVLLNRRYSTNSILESPANLLSLSPGDSSGDSSKDSEKKKKDNQGKGKNKITGTEDFSTDSVCGFEKTKKPGPSCDKEKSCS